MLQALGFVDAARNGVVLDRRMAANGWFARRGRATNAELGEAVRDRAVV